MGTTLVRQLIFYFFTIAICAMLSACGTSITRESLLKGMQEGTAPLIVDVRSRAEFDEGHIPGAMHVSFYSIGSGLSEAGISNEDSIVLYCEHGPRASIAGFSLYLSGYHHVYALLGHMKGWRKNEYPIEVLTH